MARQITEHHDGHGLTESIEILSDEQDPNAGGAAHQYQCYITTNDRTRSAERKVCADIQFQHGPRNVDGSTPGVVEVCLVAILLDRLRSFQAGPFPSRQNAIAITKLEEVKFWMRDRADERARRGVLGRNEK